MARTLTAGETRAVLDTIEAAIVAQVAVDTDDLRAAIVKLDEPRYQLTDPAEERLRDEHAA